MLTYKCLHPYDDLCPEANFVILRMCMYVIMMSTWILNCAIEKKLVQECILTNLCHN